MDHDLSASLRALTNATRLRIAGRLANGPTTSGELGAELGLAPGVLRHHLGQLVTAGLVAKSNGADRVPHYTLRLEALDRLGRRLAELDAETTGAADGPMVGPDGEALSPEVARVLRGYFEVDRLVAIPAQHTKRMVVLRYLRDRCFAEDRAYPEKEVNQRLALFHPDVAALRRYMVDEGLMTRAAGQYRRADGVGSAAAAQSRLETQERA
jgi:DNA-binding transcriptional ArsR family regulator